MKKRIGIILLSAMAIVSCNKEEALQPNNGLVELKATVYQEHTKVGFDNTGKFYWTVNDAIGVTTTTNDVSFSKMTMDASYQGKSTAVFTSRYMAGTPEGYAVYPYSKDHKMNGDVLTYTLPSSYDYTIEDHDYHVTDGSGNSFNPAMWSAISNGKVSFKHLGGILCVKIANLPAGQDQTLTVTTSNRITGEFTADLTDEAPALVTEASSENNSVTINYSNAEESTRVFYVPVPTGTYESITVAFVADGETIEIPFENKTIRLRSAQKLQIGEASIEGSEATTVENVEGANTALAEGKTSISITNVSSTENTLVIPEQSSNDTEISVEIVSAASDAAITIEEEAGTVTSASTLYLTVPETAVENVTINMPNTTVYVNGKIASLTATTAENTLVVGEGTEIEALTVKGGNVRLQEGGTIGSITAETAIKLFVEKGATLPATIGANVTVVSAAETDLLQAIADAQDGDTVTLTDNFTTSEIITIDKAITLDGNGMTITSAAGRAINVNAEGNVTIKNLTINCSGERAINVIQKPANLVIENVTATAANYTVNVATSAGAAQIAITGSTLTGKCTVNVSSPGTEVTIDGSTVNCVDDNATTGEAYAALSLNKDAVGGKIIATNTTVNVTEGSDSAKGRNSAENGTITINGSTEGVEITVAVITYAGSDYYHGFTTLAEAVEYVQDGYTITLLRDIALAENETVMINKEISLDLNGKTVTGSNSTIATFPVLFNVNSNGTLTISNGTVSYTHVGENMGWSGGIGAFNVTAGGVLNMSGVTVNASGTDMNFCVHLNNWGEVTLVADNCVFNATYCGVRVNNSGYDMNNVTISNSQLYGATRAFWVHNYIGDLDSSKHSDDAINARLNLDIFGKGNTYTLSGTATSPVRYGFNNAVFIDPETGAIIQ